MSTKDGEILLPFPPPYLAEPVDRNKYTRAKADEFCRELAKGRTLHSISQTPGLPDAVVVLWWAKVDHDGFKARFRDARRMQILMWADQCVQIADDGTNDTYIDEQTGKRKVNIDHIKRSDSRIRVRQWMLKKHMPELYGDRIKVEGAPQGEVRDEPIKQIDRRNNWKQRYADIGTLADVIRSDPDRSNGKH